MVGEHKQVLVFGFQCVAFGLPAILATGKPNTGSRHRLSARISAIPAIFFSANFAGWYYDEINRLIG